MTKIECGDIIKTKYGIMLVESIFEDGTLSGHELKKQVQYRAKDFSDIEVLNSDFRLVRPLD